MQGRRQLRTDAFNAFMKLTERDLISDEPLFREMTRYYSMYFKGGMGAEAVRDLLAAIDLPSEAEAQGHHRRQGFPEAEARRPSSASRSLTPS